MKKLKFLDEFATLALAGILLGLVLLIWPTLSGKLICYALAVALAAYGVYRIVCYFTRDLLLTMLQGAKHKQVLNVLFGLALLLGAVSGVQAGFDLRRMEDNRWYAPLVAAAIQGILGGVILANPFGTAMVLMRFIGASLLVEGVFELVFSLLVRQRQKSYFPSDED